MSATKAELSLLLRQAARAHLRLSDGDYWPSDVADAQAAALLAAGWRPCSCGSDATSLNPAEVVVHRTEGPCVIQQTCPTPPGQEPS